MSKNPTDLLEVDIPTETPPPPNSPYSQPTRKFRRPRPRQNPPTDVLGETQLALSLSATVLPPDLTSPTTSPDVTIPGEAGISGVIVATTDPQLDWIESVGEISSESGIQGLALRALGLSPDDAELQTKILSAACLSKYPRFARACVVVAGIGAHARLGAGSIRELFKAADMGVTRTNYLRQREYLRICDKLVPIGTSHTYVPPLRAESHARRLSALGDDALTAVYRWALQAERVATKRRDLSAPSSKYIDAVLIAHNSNAILDPSHPENGLDFRRSEKPVRIKREEMRRWEGTLRRALDKRLPLDHREDAISEIVEVLQTLLE
jgi:hypothetical protein